MERPLTATRARETSSDPDGPPTHPVLSRASALRFLRRLGRPSPRDLLLLAIVIAAVVTVELAFSAEPVPPGADSGHWITTSYSFIGRAHPSDFTVQPGLYPPLLFLVIGAAVVGTGSPLTAGFLVAGLLLAVYGLTCIHLARRFLRTGPGQLLFVGLAVLNGTTLQILFWGGYPNFLAFSLFNEAMVFLLAFVRTRGTLEGLLFWTFSALLYLTHQLTFAMFAGSAVAGATLVAVADRSILSAWRNRGFVAGAVLFVGTVGGYTGGTYLLGVPHPGYLFTNPATYVIDHVGLLFRIFFFAPAFLPQGTKLFFDPYVMVALLLALSGGLFFGTAALTRRWPGGIPHRLLLVTGWLSAVLFAPAAGYLAHVDTDYPRFAYFLPIPVALVGVSATEWAFLRSGATPGPRAAGPLAVRRPTRGTAAAAWLGASLVTVLLFATVSSPTVARGEAQYTSPTHDDQFLAAVDYLNHRAPSGAVLAESSETQRWVEALTARNAYSSTSPWLQFYTGEIENNELSYWAMNSALAATDGKAGLGFSGANSTVLDAAPQYVPYLEGVPFPAVRVALASFTVTVRDPNGSTLAFPELSWPTPALLRSSGSPVVWMTDAVNAFAFNETATLDGSGNAVITIALAPSAGYSLAGLSLSLKAPVPSRLGNTLGFTGFEFNGGTNFSLGVQGVLGALPTSTNLAIAGSLSVAPDATQSFVSTPRNRSVLTLNFVPPPSGFRVTVRLACGGLSNPAVHLAPTFTTPDFLAQRGVRFLLVETLPGNVPTVALFERELGYSVAYSNAEWQILAAPGTG